MLPRLKAKTLNRGFGFCEVTFLILSIPPDFCTVFIRVWE